MMKSTDCWDKSSVDTENFSGICVFLHLNKKQVHDKGEKESSSSRMLMDEWDLEDDFVAKDE